ncbi:hypothetical protein N8086_00260 [Pelagibacteraceae bacterium]|nr:hypothetical protein [Candidatus Pelagibacter sp.]MDC1485335.1 hypothetical protein [Pelagibacteraceae bacterium]
MQQEIEKNNSLKKRVEEQIQTRKKIVSDFLKDLSLKEKQVTTSKKTGINENTITRMKNDKNFVTSFDNAIALYSVYPDLNKMFLNQWIELSGLQNISEYEVQINGSITKNFDILPLLPNEISSLKIPQNIYINFKPMIVYRYQSITSLLNRQLFIFSQRGLDKNSCENFFKFLSDKICLAIAQDNKQYVGYLTKEETGYYVINPITKKIYKDSLNINEVYRLILTINDDWSMTSD